MSSCYLDASALVKLATAEPETQALRDHLAGYLVRITSRLATVEVARALLRRGRESAALADDVAIAFEGLAMVELSDSVAAEAGLRGPATLRSLDAIHLASALSLGDEVAMLITYDRRLADAARAAGLEVVAPAETVSGYQ
ncbi:MAG: type II toxin-antitoxin system VapC family toxin [Candidatus Limnocylindria bacterium]